MQDFPEDVMTLIADQLSLQDVKHARGTSAFFARNFFQSYLKKTLLFIQQKTVQQVAQGNGFELILLKDGSVYSRGKNEYGALGHGEVLEVKNFTQIKGLPRIIQTLANVDSAYYLSDSGNVYITGQDRLHLITGQHRVDLLDNAKKVYCRTPYIVPKLNKIITMSTSTKTSFFVSESGKVFGCGTNDSGQVLPGCRGVMQELVEIPHVKNAKNVVASSFHTIIQCDDYFNSFGENGSGQLCLGHCLGIPSIHSFKLDFKPENIRVTTDATYFLRNCDQLYLCGKVAKNGNNSTKRYKKVECVGAAKDWPNFISLLKTPEVDVPHASLIPEIEKLCNHSITASKQPKVLPLELITKLNQFSQLLKTTITDTGKITHNKDDCASRVCVSN
ncbi:MAG: hypothetical protein K2X50_05260 [Gammaproteobacteria bacterium]|nr:hypothetical protein [Gammaproteobacteria bacterium]